MNSCCCCSSRKIAPLLDFGLQPISNRFLISPDAPEEGFPLGIFLCNHCGLLTITKPIPSHELQPRADWIQYQEPEAHLNDLMEQWSPYIKNLSSSASIFGFSCYDQAIIQRLEAKNINNHSLFSSDLGIETIQKSITPLWAEKFLQQNKKQDIIIARYILEHSQNIASFLESIRMILSPNGYVIFEVPDFSPSLLNFEYSNLWEEHSFYFTPTTLKLLLKNHGFVIKQFQIYPSPLENIMSVLCQLAPTEQEPSVPLVYNEEVAQAKNYAAHFQHRRKQLQQCLTQLQQSGKIAIFGAGHLAIKFINLFDLSEFISFIVDDHPQKCGLFLPGSHLPIKPTTALLEEKIDCCLLSINPEREEHVMKTMSSLFEAGKIATYSIFSASSRTLPLPL